MKTEVKKRVLAIIIISFIIINFQICKTYAQENSLILPENDLSTDHLPRSFDLSGINWANHAITCGRDTNNYNAWAPHNLQYDETRDCFVFLQCHANKHIDATFSNWTLSIINPYDTTDYKCIDIPAFNGLGMLVVNEGVWTLIPRGQSYIYRSTDGGNNWEQLAANIPAYIFGVYQVGNTYFAGNDSNDNITFFRSTDLTNWTEEAFVIEDNSFTVLCESCFCEFKGKIYAFNRTNNSELGCVVLVSDDYGETWTQCVDFPLHSYRTTTSCIALSDCILIADLDRDGGMLYLQKYDGESFITKEIWEISAGDDLHSVNIVTDYQDTIVIEFMQACAWTSPAYFRLDHFSCDNVMLVGSRNQLPSLEINYFSSPESLLDFSNTYLNKTVLGRTVNWEYDGRKIKANLNVKVSSFIDEIELPLNFLQITETTNRIDTTLKLGSNFVRPMNNDMLYSPINQDTHKSVISMSSRIGYIDIKGVRYAYGASGYDCLPVLTRADNLYHLGGYPISEGYNNIVGQDWQETLPFRRVFSVFESAAGTDQFSIFTEAILNDPDACSFAMINYNTVN